MGWRKSKITINSSLLEIKEQSRRTKILRIKAKRAVLGQFPTTHLSKIR